MAYSNRKTDESKPKVDIGMNYEMVDLMLQYVLCESPLINLRALLNLKTLVDKVNFTDEVYDNRLKFDLLKNILFQEMESHIFNISLLKLECAKGFTGRETYVHDILDEGYTNVVDDTAIEYINEYVEKRLTYFYLFENKTKLKNAIEILENSDSMEDVNLEFEQIIFKLNKDIQNSKAVRKDAATDFCLAGGTDMNKNKNLEAMTKTTIDDLNNPSNHIKTGVKSLNAMLGGGWENGRAYLAYAPPKSWKSGLLMNAGIHACKYNLFVPKDPTKIPCVLYVTMENTSKETIKRIFSHITGEDIKDYNYADAVKIINDYIIGDRNITFEIRYRKTKSISTTDLDAMIDELALEGKEVVFLIQDYLKRIRSSENNPDLRLELGESTNDFCSIARTRDIPVLSAMQINRVGISKIEAAMALNRGNLAKIIDKSDAGESALPLENVDYAFAISPEDDLATGERFLGFKLWVSRVETTGPQFFLQKFENGMKLHEDINEQGSTSVESLSNAPKKDFNPNQLMGRKWEDASGKVKARQVEFDNKSFDL